MVNAGMSALPVSLVSLAHRCCCSYCYWRIKYSCVWRVAAAIFVCVATVAADVQLTEEEKTIREAHKNAYFARSDLIRVAVDGGMNCPNLLPPGAQPLKPHMTNVTSTRRAAAVFSQPCLFRTRFDHLCTALKSNFFPFELITSGKVWNFDLVDWFID